MKLELFSMKHSPGSDIAALAAELFETEMSFLFLNDQLDVERKRDIYSQLTQFGAQSQEIKSRSLFIPTSGSTSTQLKIVVIKKENFLTAAKGANDFLGSRSSDIWMLSLPSHHVAGLSILARAYLNKNRVYYWPKWEPKEFAEKIAEWGISFCSLVPTQVFDLAEKEIPSPRVLKKVLIGGSAISDSLAQKMKHLGWPLVRTYGMTETSAFMSFSLGSSEYTALPGVEVKLDSQQHLCIRSDSLFDGYLAQKNGAWSFEPKKLVDGFWTTEDRGFISAENESQFQILGRDQSMIKIKGELVNLGLLNSRCAEIVSELNLSSKKFLIHSAPDERNENELLLIYENSEQVEQCETLVKKYNASVLPFERIHWLLSVDSIPRTDLGKVKTGTLESKEFKERYYSQRKYFRQ